jgi:cytochrome c oxidase subunit 1
VWKFIFGLLGMIYVMVSIGLFGFIVWGYYMYIVGMDVDIWVYFTAATMIIVVLIGIKVFSWIVILWGGVLKVDVVMLFIIGFIFFFIVGGLIGIILFNAAFDIAFYDIYYVVVYFYYVLFFEGVFFKFL